jgi:type IV secretory pathway VirB10-like protein
MTQSEQKDRARHDETLRVVDRRSFTAEGERRLPDAASEETPVLPLPPPQAPASTASPKSRTGPAVGESSAAEEQDPVASAHFQNLVLNLARQAAASLGATRHPLTGQIEIDLEAAQQMIALLQALRLKTQGNRSADETELLEGLIADLQMQYVATRSKATQKP